MNKIATHNSATGEKPGSILSWIVLPFSRCQSKTIKEQHQSGCRFFDIRVKRFKSGWYCAHGLFRTKRTVLDILGEIDHLGGGIVRIMYEGSADSEMEKELNARCSQWEFLYKNISLTRIAVKLPQQRTLLQREEPECREKYLGLCWGRWQTLFPIPWLWKKIYYNKPEFSEEYYTMVDFL